MQWPSPQKPLIEPLLWHKFGIMPQRQFVFSPVRFFAYFWQDWDWDWSINIPEHLKTSFFTGLRLVFFHFWHGETLKKIFKLQIKHLNVKISQNWQRYEVFSKIINLLTKCWISQSVLGQFLWATKNQSKLVHIDLSFPVLVQSFRLDFQTLETVTTQLITYKTCFFQTLFWSTQSDSSYVALPPSYTKFYLPQHI